MAVICSLAYRNFVTDKDISSAVAALERVHHDLAQRLNDPRLAEVPEVCFESISSAAADTCYSPVLAGSLQDSLKGHQVYPFQLCEVILIDILGPSALLQEIEGLRVLESQMSRNVEAMHARRNEHQFRKSWKGRIWTLIGRSFAFYCVIRIISVRYALSSEFAGID